MTPFTSSSVLSPVQVPYSSSLLSLGGYTSTSSTTYNSPSANYYHDSPIAGVTPFTSSSVLSSVQAPYSSSLTGLGGFYTSTSSTTYNPSSANYYHLPIAGGSPFTSTSSHYQYPPTASTTTSYRYSGASGNQSVSPSSSWSSSPAYKPQKPRDSSKDKCVVYLYIFCISMNFFVVMYAIFLHTDLWTRRKNTKKEKKTIHIYITDSYTITFWSKRKKEIHPSTFFSSYMKKLIKISSKWSRQRKDRMLIRFIFAPFHIVGLQLIVWLSDHCLD